MRRSQGLRARLFLLALAIPPAMLISGCFPHSSDPAPNSSSARRSEKRDLPGTGGAVGTGDDAGAAASGDSPDAGASAPDSGIAGAGGAAGQGGASAPGTTPDENDAGGVGGRTGGSDTPLSLGGQTGSIPGAGGAAGATATGPDGPRGAGGAGGATGTGAGGATSVTTPACSVHCALDPPYCQCSVDPAECPQLFQVTCRDGAAGPCVCRLNGEVTATLPAGNACGPGLLTATDGCGFALVIPN